MEIKELFQLLGHLLVYREFKENGKSLREASEVIITVGHQPKIVQLQRVAVHFHN